MRSLAPLIVLGVLAACASLSEKPKEAARPKFVARWSKVCRADEEKFCAKWSAKDGTTADCLARVEKELSGRCYQSLREAASPCVFDRARLCSHVKPTDPNVWSCLQEHGKEVSLSCRTFRSDLKTREVNLRKACGSDAERFCASHGGAPWRCLRENLDQVSGQCRSVLGRSLRGPRAG